MRKKINLACVVVIETTIMIFAMAFLMMPVVRISATTTTKATLLEALMLVWFCGAISMLERRGRVCAATSLRYGVIVFGTVFFAKLFNTDIPYYCMIGLICCDSARTLWLRSCYTLCHIIPELELSIAENDPVPVILHLSNAKRVGLFAASLLAALLAFAPFGTVILKAACWLAAGEICTYAVWMVANLIYEAPICRHIRR